MQPKPVILAFDTAAAHCAAVVVQGSKILASAYEPMAKGQAERLFPLMEDVLAQANKTWQSLDAIGVGTGPGNFTGIRISVSAARGLSLSLDIPAIGVSRPEAIAYGTMGETTVVIDARQNRIYAQPFQSGQPKGDIKILAGEDAALTGDLLCDGPVDLDAKQISPQNCVHNIALIAATKLGQSSVKPAPLYVRAPDAALPSEQPPVILP